MPDWFGNAVIDKWLVDRDFMPAQDLPGIPFWTSL